MRIKNVLLRTEKNIFTYISLFSNMLLLLFVSRPTAQDKDQLSPWENMLEEKVTSWQETPCCMREGMLQSVVYPPLVRHTGIAGMTPGTS